jgi:hypothetical protein
MVLTHWRRMVTRRTTFFAIILLGLSSLTIHISVSHAQGAPSAQQLAKAREELLLHLKNHPRKELEERKYLIPGENIEDAILGQPYAFYRTEPQCLQDLTDYSLFKQCLTFCFWSIPVSFGGKARFVLDLYDKDGEWRLARYGADPNSIEEARSRWPKSQGYDLSFLRFIGRAGMDFIMVEKGRALHLYSIGEGSNKVLGVARDQSGRYPLLDVPYVVKKLRAPENPPAPKMD